MKKDFDIYSFLNDFLLKFIMSGEGNSEEAEDIRREMDLYWSNMTEDERNQMRKRNESIMVD